jgi:hypothetical protein
MLNIMEDNSPANLEDQNSTRELHNSLSRICKNLPTDFQPWGERDRDAEWGPDCSCGCKFFLKLPGQLGNDWGVCWNAEHRLLKIISVINNLLDFNLCKF